MCIAGFATDRRMYAHDQYARIEIRLPEPRRRELVELAAEKGVSSAGLVRLAINWLIEHPDAILKFPQEAA